MFSFPTSSNFQKKLKINLVSLLKKKLLKKDQEKRAKKQKEKKKARHITKQ